MAAARTSASQPENINSLPPGQAITITGGEFEIQRFADSAVAGPLLLRVDLFRQRRQHARRAQRLPRAQAAGRGTGPAGERLGVVPLDDDTIVVPVPDTGKAAADAMAFALGVPSLEGLIRNRYSGRTFIEGAQPDARTAETKYTPLREVLRRQARVPGRGLDRPLDDDEGAPQPHSRRWAGPARSTSASPARRSSRRASTASTCRTVNELFAPKFCRGGQLTDEVQAEMADALGADSLRYLPVESIARAIGLDRDQLCQACITGDIRRPAGQELYQIALDDARSNVQRRAYETMQPAK